MAILNYSKFTSHICLFKSFHNCFWFVVFLLKENTPANKRCHDFRFQALKKTVDSNWVTFQFDAIILIFDNDKSFLYIYTQLLPSIDQFFDYTIFVWQKVSWWISTTYVCFCAFFSKQIMSKSTNEKIMFDSNQKYRAHTDIMCVDWPI